MAVEALARELRRGCRGEVRLARQVRGADLDFGRMISKPPLVVATTTCEEDLCHVLKTARAAQLQVSVQGAGHSCNGQSLVDGGILIRNVADGPQPLTSVGDHRVEISGRSRWSQVDRALARFGERIPDEIWAQHAALQKRLDN